MGNSKLASYTKLTHHNGGKRTHKIDTITIHCMVAQWTAKQACDYFCDIEDDASCNYAVGTDGSIGVSVNEDCVSYCSSSFSNDNRAVTIEVASDRTAPYKITDKAMKSLINLCIDICKRNDIKKLLWKNDKLLVGCIEYQNMTVHRWFANKDCPGDYLMSKMSYIANEVNKQLALYGTGVYQVVKDSTLRAGAGTDYKITGYIKDRLKYTIIEVDGKWGKLKSGAGWIWLGNCKKV